MWGDGMGIFRTALAGLLLAATAAMAGPREDTLAGISRCAGLPDDRVFLDCIYGAAQPMRARLGLPPAPVAQLRLVPPASAAPVASPQAAAAPAPRNAGMFNLFGDSGLHMTSYNFDKRGQFTVTLSDGSIWRQAASDTNFAHFSGKASDYSVSLVAGQYGKARLDVRGEPGPYTVKKMR
jgi:hypothetical protein